MSTLITEIKGIFIYSLCKLTVKLSLVDHIYPIKKEIRARKRLASVLYGHVSGVPGLTVIWVWQGPSFSALFICEGQPSLSYLAEVISIRIVTDDNQL